MKIKVTLSIDKEIKNKAMFVCQNILNSSLSKEVEEYLKKIVEGVDIGKRG